MGRHPCRQTPSDFIMTDPHQILRPHVTDTDRQTRQTDRQTDRQTNRQTNTLTDRPASDPPLSQTHVMSLCWYCPDCPWCEEGCKEHKRKAEFAKIMNGNIAPRCLACEYPKCHQCGYQHPRTARAVQERHKIDGKWFCGRTRKCQEIIAAAREAAQVLK